MTLRVLIVDDETWARRRIAGLLEAEPDVEIVGECADGAAAVQDILALSPDLVFLDVQMPEFDGFDVLHAVGTERMPLVVFATAYDAYAVKAFEANALDYLLKPFDEERFHRSLERAREEIQKTQLVRGEGLQALIRALGDSRRHLRRLAVKDRGRVLFLPAGDVDWFEAAGNYVTLHVGSSEYLIRDTVSGLEARLDPDQFVRIHRSTIVNLDRVQGLAPWAQGEQVMTLKDGTTLTVGRAFRGRLDHLLRNAPD